MFEFTIPTGGVPRSPRSIATSVFAHAIAIALLFAFRFSGISNFPAAPERVTLIAPVENLAPRPKMKPIQPRDLPAPPKARLDVRPRPPISVPIIYAPEIETPKPVAFQEPVAPLISLPEPVHETKPVIKPSGFTEAKTLPPVAAAKLQVKDGGFETQSVSENASSHSALAQVGSFDSARASEAAATGQIAPLKTSGFGGASTSPAPGARHTTVTSGMFGDASVGTNQQAPLREAALSRSTPVEILSKPKPLYTAEARAQRIEGEVLLEVEFSALGEVSVLRLVRGLGHGLDENAAAAARGIRFRPASRASVAVDSTAIVHIIFELAN